MVQDFELDSGLCAGVRYLKEEPLRVAVGVDVILQQQVVLAVADFRHHRQVAALEARLEDEGAVIGSSGSVEGRKRGIGGSDGLFGGLAIGHLGYIAGPDIPVLLDVVNLAVALLLVLAVYNIVESLPDPVAEVVLLELGQRNGFVQWLEIRDESDEGRERQHRGEGFGLVTDRLGQEHEWWRDEMLGDQEIEGFLQFLRRDYFGREFPVGTVIVHRNKIT